MPITLHLGVVDIPYVIAVPAELRRVRTRARRMGKRNWVDQGAATAPASGGQTTYDVATILEAKYHIMETFLEEVGANLLSAAFAHSAEVALESLLMGRPAAEISLTAEATSEIEAAFRDFLSLRMMDGRVPGVPTLAALKGINHRFKHPYAKKNPERPSFIDTGTYQASFRAWVD